MTRFAYSGDMNSFLGKRIKIAKANPDRQALHFVGKHGGIVSYHPSLGGRSKSPRIPSHLKSLKAVRVSPHIRAPRPGKGISNHIGRI